MKTIVFVALLAAAGCSKKSSDCEASIGKGIDNFAATIKKNAPNAQIQESKLGVLGKLKGTLTLRCTEDKWPPEVVSCFSTVSTMRDMQACQSKLSTEQRTKLSDELREIMMSTMGGRMPGVAGHPSTIPGSGAPGDPDGPAAPAGSMPSPAGSAAAPAPAGSDAPVPASGSNAK